ncbi:MAG: SH3 domain-containing protein [Lachnospiraceae bacterium]|nr:SH3 domain-containing protein [Lachnospiraceae bacterium]
MSRNMGRHISKKVSKKIIKLSSIGMAALFFVSGVFQGNAFMSFAATADEILPSGGAGLVFGSASDARNGMNRSAAKIEDVIDTREEMDRRLAVNAEEEYNRLIKNIAVADTEDFIYVRESADKSSDYLGKLYKDGVGEILEKEEGWYLIDSGSITGYVEASECITGEAAEALAPEIGYELAAVTTPSLYVRENADSDSEVVCVVKNGEEFLVKDRKDGWLKIETVSGDGWISGDYADTEWQFSEAESREEETIRLAEESYEKGRELAEYALQFVGNPYVWGGSSLTNGCDCSGFTMALYAHYGIKISHGVNDQRVVGVAVDGLENAQPGDIMIYSGHVAIYIGNNQIVHAANSRMGIIVSGTDFMTLLGIRRIF